MGLAVVIIGPKDFPIVLKKIGSGLVPLKDKNNLQDEVSNLENNNFDLIDHTNNNHKEIKKDDDK